MKMGYSWGSDTSTSWGGGGFSYGSAKKSYDEDKVYVPKATKAQMNSAYALSTKLMDAALPKKEKELLEKLTKEDVLVVPGQYDQVQDVLKAAGTPHTVSSAQKRLSPEQILLINCPGNNLNVTYKGTSGLEAVRGFVEDGGYVVSTDWALTQIVEGFPGYISKGGKNTADDVVEVDLVASKSPYTRGLGEGSLKPVWWLESSSYPIKIGRSKDVDVLLGSEEMRQKYGEMPIAVKFAFGEGRVIHVTSHFYLQTAKSKYEAQAKKTGLDFATKYIGMAADEASEIKGLGEISFGALESSYTSLRFLHNIFVQKLKDKSGLEKKLDPQEVKELGTKLAKSLKQLPEGKKSKKLI